MVYVYTLHDLNILCCYIPYSILQSSSLVFVWYSYSLYLSSTNVMFSSFSVNSLYGKTFNLENPSTSFSLCTKNAPNDSPVNESPCITHPFIPRIIMLNNRYGNALSEYSST